MKKLLICLMTFILAVCFLTGCGASTEKDTNNDNNADTNDSSNNDNNNVEYNDKTKVNNLSQSMAKYSTLKEKVMKDMTEKATNSGNVAISLGILPFATVDLMTFPATVCGQEDASVKAALAIFYNTIDYKVDGNNCTFTYKDNNSVEGKFVSNYDPSTDSARMENYQDGKLVFVTEYYKIDNGYVTQFYSVDDTDNTYDAYKSQFIGSNITTGSFEGLTTAPSSIYKNGNIGDLKTNASMYIEVKDGVTTAIVNGETIDLSSFNTQE